MYSTRWWDIAVAGGLAAITAFAVAGAVGSGWPGSLGATASILVFALGYLLIRPGIVRGAARPWRLALGVPAIAAAILFGIATVPFLAMLQALAFPLVWITTTTRRGAVLGSTAVAGATFLGFWAGGGFALSAMWWGLLTAGVSLGFAVALGLWIGAIADYGEDRARLVAELTAAQEQVEVLSRERGAAAERERLGRDIHDTLAQTLAGLALLSERARRQLGRGEADAAAATIATVEQLSRDALAEARSLIARTAAVPADTALGDAVERLVERFRTEAGLAVEMTVDLDHDAGTTRETQLVVLRCLQEALSNIRKHADAESVRVTVSAGRDRARLEVSDDGGGFDVDARRTGFGLDGMTDRVALAGGTLTVDSVPGGGTVLAVDLPAMAASAPTRGQNA
ncbi:sensor histidine kinase [Microbacterium sp. SSW1-59]|uniref:sensor histidine kinase n=1 Tax=Microbacterium xanthum TaxID=3079794 RepID=UPI002AD29A8C|nr:sensor histidine kinase [Microbacterium sp. SSW1-59]MDZ8200099.1 sensor histidine kinase [Microbacterium sp. SSW1-59]